MARTVIDTKLAKREQRLRLTRRKEPYWMTINEGEHLGYYRGARVAKWVARYRNPEKGALYQRTTLGEADDNTDSDGVVIYSFKEAQDAARKWFLEIHRSHGRKVGKYTVSDALDDYISGFQGKDLANTKRRIEAIIRPALGKFEVVKLKSQLIVDWRNDLAASPARLRTKKGENQNFRDGPETNEDLRKRKSSANRILTILKAALNSAYRSGKVSNDDAWRKVQPFRKVEKAKLRYLRDDEARRLVNACNQDFRPMIQAALLTGARYSEIAGLEVRDFDYQSETLWLRETKTGKGRAVYLDKEGFDLFKQAIMGKEQTELIFKRPDGKKWGPSQQSRPLAAACRVAKIESAGFHDLRRTYGARMALQGVPMAVIAEALGHADERITRKHYAHLTKSYVAETIRGAVSGQGIVDKGRSSNIDRFSHG